MTKKMLIDASHPEETRVVIVDGNRVEELDFESRHKRQIRGNVYLARVTRVEPSLQAAFVEYGGNRHGFLAFSEIHPDYYQIPHEDKLALLKAEEAEHKEAEAEEEDKAKKSSRRKSAQKKAAEISDDELDEDDVEADNEPDDDDRDENVDPDAEDAADEADAEVADEQAKVASKRRKRTSRRRYKIQEVIKRGQILLIQAVKEERGNKGAAMTSYLSLAGRYCVLMPNTARGGGISRKIANSSDRKRLKSVMSELEVPQGMGVIVRTAGAKRTKAEIKRDYEYLSRLWDTIRDTTMNSIAPALIHEEGNLVKRSIRDLYNKDISEILVQGDEAYKNAKAFIKMLMPSHAKNVKAYKDDIPMFLRYNVERQIEDSLKSVVQLKSGGYLVIHPTEALVSIDVNSGRSTKERNIERTALKTNLETADEVARQMRLRDLAGLIVIDFIDMDDYKNNRAVERRMKDALAQDRARVQTSKISQFGLMEISRQRRRRSLLEGSTAHCEHCEGVGRKRTIESSALVAIRAVEEVGARGRAKRIRLKVSSDVALYIFNEKRDLLQHVDDTSGVFTELVGDEELIRPAYDIEVLEKAKDSGPDPLEEIEKEFKKQRHAKPKQQRRPKKDDADEETSEDGEAEPRGSHTRDDDGEGGDRKKRRRRRGRRGGRGKRRDETTSEDASDALEVIEPAADKDKTPKRGRRRKAPAKEAKVEATTEAVDAEDSAPKHKRTTRKAPMRKPKADEASAKDAPKKTRRKAPAKKAKAAEADEAPAVTEETKEKPKARSTSRRRAPAKKADAKAVEEKPKAKTSRRKAPAKRAAASEVETPKEKAKPKPAARRKAPAKTKAAPKKTAPKKATPKKTADTPKRKPAARKKAPAKAKAETAPAAAAEDKPKASTARRKAPTRKTAAVEEASISTDVEAVADPIAEKPKKRGWFGRKKK